jgi:hypothetical protein
MRSLHEFLKMNDWEEGPCRLHVSPLGLLTRIRLNLVLQVYTEL